MRYDHTGGNIVWCLAVLWLYSACAMGTIARDDRPPRGMKATVVDASNKPIAQAKVYDRLSFKYDSRESKIEFLQEEHVLYVTDQNGLFHFELPRLGCGVLFLVVDDSLSRMGYLRVSRKEVETMHTIVLEPPARIRGFLDTDRLPRTGLNAALSFREPIAGGGYRILSLATIAYDVSEPSRLLPLDVACPSLCPLEFSVYGDDRRDRVVKDIAPLESGQLHELGEIVLDKRNGDNVVVSGVAPDLKVGKWVGGKPTSLEKLKGKVVLLCFWASWCPQCRKEFPSLVRLHGRYFKDGLRIIALHDTSLTEEAFVEATERISYLSDASFRLALDCPVDDASQGDNRIPGAGKGKTIASYGVSGFPTHVLVARDGTVDFVGRDDLEKRINVLLYGHAENLLGPLSPGEELLHAAIRKLFVAAFASGGFVLVGFYCIRISRKRMRA